MKKILTVVGARPQFIKAAIVSKAIGQFDGLVEVLLHTGQHYDNNMSDIFFKELDIARPKYHLGIGGGTHGQNTGRMLEKIEEVIIKEKPDMVLVYGDTNSTLAGALAAAKLNIPISHVESGLRSFNSSMPEEVNRILTDRISHWLFTPTQTANENLVREGFPSEKIIKVGDVMYDTALHYGEQVQLRTGLMEKLGLKEKSYILATIHRAENTDNAARLLAIVESLSKISKSLPIVWPMHPRTHSILKHIDCYKIIKDKINIINPLGYLDMIKLEKNASLIVTDSGGVQKEAFFYEIPCVTLRDETEWVELIDAGWNILASPTSVDAMTTAMFQMIGTKGREIKPYGNGDASKKIASHIYQNL